MGAIFTNTFIGNRQSAKLAAETYASKRTMPRNEIIVIILYFLVDFITIYLRPIWGSAGLLVFLFAAWGDFIALHCKTNWLAKRTSSAEFYDNEIIYSIGSKQKRIPYKRLTRVCFNGNVIVLLYRFGFAVLARDGFHGTIETDFCAFLDCKKNGIPLDRCGSEVRSTRRALLWRAGIPTALCALLAVLILREYALGGYHDYFSALLQAYRWSDSDAWQVQYVTDAIREEDIFVTYGQVMENRILQDQVVYCYSLKDGWNRWHGGYLSDCPTTVAAAKNSHQVTAYQVGYYHVLVVEDILRAQVSDSEKSEVYDAPQKDGTMDCLVLVSNMPDGYTLWVSDAAYSKEDLS